MSEFATYTFLPWLRQGVSTQIKQEDSLNGASDLPQRPQFAVKLTVKGKNIPPVPSLTETIEKQIELYGPGDVTGFDPRLVIRTDPKPDVGDFEPNYFPLVEFAEPDFPWRFTPVKANAVDRLRPWLCLIALKEDEFELVSDPNMPLPFIKVKNVKNSLPNPEQTWAWAHVQVFGNLGNLKNLRQQEPEKVISRLLCPRKLDEGTKYHAFVVPAFEVGRLAGLGEKAIPANISGTEPAWDIGQDKEVLLPVYYSWSFRTGLRGDFEYLARLLEKRLVDQRVGKRKIDIKDPGLSVHGIPSEVYLEGALVPVGVPSDELRNTADFKNDLANVLNSPQVLMEGGVVSNAVVPPIYGCWHAAQHKVDPNWSGWLNQLNLDPRFRAVAAFGTQVIQEQQEHLMASAWEQLGDIQEANQILREAQLARVVSERIKAKHFDKLPKDAFITITNPVHRRILYSNGQTISDIIQKSKLTTAAISPAFRRILRPAGVLRRIDKSKRFISHIEVVGKLYQGTLEIVGSKILPDGIIDSNKLAGMGLKIGKLTPKIDKENVPPRDKFEITTDSTTPGGQFPRDKGGQGEFGKDSTDARNFRQASIAILNYTTRAATNKEKPLSFDENELKKLQTALSDNLVPRNTVFAHIQNRLILDGVTINHSLDTIMAAPKFPQPMYEFLRDLSQEIFLPGIEHISQNSVTLLQTNQRFVEAYLLGLNHEMGKELLWREYPTDQRGTYFQQFWDVRSAMPQTADANCDISMVDTWLRNSNLGDHGKRFDPAQAPLVLLVRGDLLKKYPTAAIYAAQVIKDQSDKDQIDEQTVRFPTFRGTLPPDITFLGFANLTRAKIEQDKNWYFVIQEQPAEPRFGLDMPNEQKLDNWNDLSWSHLAKVLSSTDKYIDFDADNPKANGLDPEWGKNGESQACIHLQHPVRIAISAGEMLPKPNNQE